MSSALNAALSFSHLLEDEWMDELKTELPAPDLELITEALQPDSYPCVRASLPTGAIDGGLAYTVARLSIKTDAGQSWLGQRILHGLLAKMELSTELYAEMGAWWPERDWASHQTNAPLTGDAFRVTPNSSNNTGNIWQTVTDDPEIWHVQLNLRIYHN